MDLLNKIFVIDESARITLKGIQEHPWYNTPLDDQYSAAYKQFRAEQADKDRYTSTRRLNQVSSVTVAVPYCPISCEWATAVAH